MTRDATPEEWKTLTLAAQEEGRQATTCDVSGEWADRKTSRHVIVDIRHTARTPADVRLSPEEENELLDSFQDAWYEAHPADCDNCKRAPNCAVWNIQGWPPDPGTCPRKVPQ